MRVGSYVQLPDKIANKKAIRNHENIHDHECFKWSMLAELHHTEIDYNPESIYNLRVFEYRHDWSGLQFLLMLTLFYPGGGGGGS